jgi:hypothetical protein
MAGPAPAFAANEDIQAWGAATIVHDASAKVVLTLETQSRWTEDASRIGQALVRPSIGYKLGSNTTASIGYAFVHTDPLGPASSNEHRLWQQIGLRLAGDGKGVTVTGRSRLEQRWMEGSDDMGWRLRQQLRLTAPLSGKVRAVAWSEAFVSLDDTSWGQNSGLDRWRNSVGLSVPVSKAVTIEPGYINQWVVRPGQDRVHHIGNLSVTARF